MAIANPATPASPANHQSAGIGLRPGQPRRSCERVPRPRAFRRNYGSTAGRRGDGDGVVAGPPGWRLPSKVKTSADDATRGIRWSGRTALTAARDRRPTVHDTEQRDDGGLVGGDRIEIAHARPSVGRTNSALAPDESHSIKQAYRAGRSTAKAFGANMAASPLNAGAVGCREHRDQVMQGGEPPLSDVGSGEDGRGSASAPRRNAMANLAAISPCAGSASANAMGAGCWRVARLRFPAKGAPTSRFHMPSLEANCTRFPE